MTTKEKTEKLLKKIEKEERQNKEIDEILENSYIAKSHIMDAYNNSKG